MQSGPDNVAVTLARRVPVFILYGTAIAYENNEVHFYDDIYGHDAKLAAGAGEGLSVSVISGERTTSAARVLRRHGRNRKPA